MTTIIDRRVSVWNDRIHSHVKVSGSGPPLVFLHRAGGIAWDPFLDALAARHTVYAAQHPGLTDGDADAISHLDNLGDLVHYYCELFDGLGLRSAALVGHSFGAMMAAELAARRPERVSKLVLMCPIGLWREDAPIPNWMIVTPASELSKCLLYDPDGPLARKMFGVPDTELQMRMLWSIASAGKFAWPIPHQGLKKRIRAIQAPTLILWGKQDRLVPVSYAEEFARRIPNATVETIDRAGHLFPAEHPERVAELVEDFLA